MKRFLLATVAVVALAGCQKKSEEHYKDEAAAPSMMALETAMVSAPAPAPAPRAADADAPAAAEAPAAGGAAGPARPIVISAPMLAYSYRYGLETPADQLQALIKTHEKACLAAGPTVCQMVGQRVSGEGKDRMEGELSLRATPAWLTPFRDGLGAQAKAAGGRVVSSNTESEDLTRQIVDTEAAVRAKTTLRDRLQALLASRPGKLSELLEVERELARVQEEIDATQSQLAVMKTRVATSALTIHYASAGVLAPEGVLSPLGRAFSDALSIMVGVLAGIVRLAAFFLPLAAIIAMIVWPFRKKIRWPQRKKKTGWRPPGSPDAGPDQPA